MYCCANCFQDRVIRDYIEKHSTIFDNCHYCGDEDIQVVYTSELYYKYFKNIESYYEVSQHGEHYAYQLVNDISGFGDTLYNMLQDDWLIFPDGTGESLLYDIMNENKDDELGETIDETTFFSTVEKTFTYRDGSDLWNTFKKRLIKENRFFPNQELDTFTSLNELYGLLEDIMINLKVSISEDSSIYRSRIGHFTEIIDLQAPPFEKVLKGGRANPVGISVLYCAETPETAISEVRPWKGAEVTVATIYPTKDLVLVDLSSVEKLESPFITSNLREVLTSRKLLLNLQEMLSKPVNPNTSEIEYIPSQFLTEFIKSLGYDGIVFKSSLGLNNNLVIFDEGNTVIKGLSYYNLTDIRINYTQI